MGTRSVIGVMHGNKAKTVYCHWDGYLDHNGRILLEHYNSSKANHLVAMGGLSSLGKELGEKHPFSPHECDSKDPLEQKRVQDEYNAAKDKGWCTFYKRDRDEEGNEFQVCQSDKEMYEQYPWCEYFYLMQDGVWYVSQGADTEWKVLSDAIREEDEPGYKAPSVTRFIGMLESA
jgi:hypothetical protein